jgi:flagellar protein FliO/FliZ
LSGEDLLRAMAALLVVLGTVALAAWGARRLGLPARLGASTGASCRLELVETRWLDSRARVVLVRADAREHLLVLTPDGPLELGAGRPCGAAPSTDGAT